MKNQIPWNLLGKYFSGESTDDEQKQLMQWVESNELHRNLFSELQQVWNDTEKPKQEWNVGAAWKRVDHLTKDAGGAASDKKILRSYKTIGTSRRHTKKKYALAAAAVFLLAAFIGWYSYSGQSVAPPAFKEIITQSDEQSRIKLKDGSVVTINEQSTLRIPHDFSKSNRNIYLDGEAFFDVSHDGGHPFKVYTSGAVTRVLGTRFNVKVNAPSQNVQVAVVEGRVALYPKGENQHSGGVINPYHLGQLNFFNDSVSVQQVDIRNCISWLTGRLVFENTSLSQISRQLEYVYNVDFEFVSDQLKKERITADFEKTSLKDALDIISGSLGIGYRKEGKKVVWKE